MFKNSKSAKVFAGVVGFAMVVAAFGAVVAPVKAQGTDLAALTALIASLQAQIAALSGGSSSTMTGVAPKAPLTMGSSGAQVTALQNFLDGNGYDIPAGATGYFGGQTQAALMAFQAENGVSPAAGYYGSVTEAKVASMLRPATPSTPATPATPSTPVTTGLQGGAGSVQDYNLISGLSGEEVGEKENDVKVAGLEIEADEGSDLQITAVKLVFNEGTAGSDFEDYADEVSVWFNGKEVARVDGDSFNDDNDWTRTLSLSGAVVKADKTGDLVVAVSGVNNLDSGDVGETWTVDFLSVRFVDEQNASTTEDPGTAVRTFSFETFATASDVEMKVSLNDDDDTINEAHVINVDDSDDTEDVEILSFTIEADGNSDIEVKDIPVNVNVTGASNIDDMITEITLWNGAGQVGDAVNVGTGVGADETYTFENVDVEVNAGDTEEFMVKVSFKSTADVDLDNGDTISAQLSATEVDAIDADDESGEAISDTDATGTAVGEAHAVYDTGIMVQFVSATQVETLSADEAGESDQGEFKVTFKVKSFDADARIDRSCEEGGANAAGQGVEFVITNSGDNTTTCVMSSSSTDSEDTTDTYEVDDNGLWRTMTLTVNATATSTAFAEISFESINWGVATDDTNANYYTFNLGDYKTGPLNLADL